MGIVERYLQKLNKEKRRWRCAAAILTVLSLVVVASVFWKLRMTGVAIANGAACGKEEHQHTEQCPRELRLACEYAEPEEHTEPEQTEEPMQHVHTDACYEIVYQCGCEEHIHELACYSDLTADLESWADWEASIPELTGWISEDIVIVALSL